MFPFSKPKSFVDYYPQGVSAYQSLNPSQKRVLDEFANLEKTHQKDDKRRAKDRIVTEYIVGFLKEVKSSKELKQRCEQVFERCKTTLQSAPLTVNVSGELFNKEGFWENDDFKTVWTVNAGKGWNYTQTRQQVEENVFGYKIDWSVKISEAAKTRPAYAGLNYTSHPYGAAAAYGSVNFVLKSDVNPRCTYINTDTFDNQFNFARGTQQEVQASRNKICTYGQFETLMANLGKSQLVALCQSAEYRYVLTDHPPNYIEAQVHGGVEWTRDVAEIKVAGGGASTLEKEAKVAKVSEDTLKYLIAAFAKKLGVSAKIYKLNKVIEVLNIGA